MDKYKKGAIFIKWKGSPPPSPYTEFQPKTLGCVVTIYDRDFDYIGGCFGVRTLVAKYPTFHHPDFLKAHILHKVGCFADVQEATFFF